MKFINPVLVDAFLEVVGGGFFTVQFMKKDNTTRVMRCRKGVKKHLKGGVSTIKDKKELISVYSLDVESYRCFDKNKVIEIKGAGARIMTSSVEVVSA
jgi:hypothetical protein